MPHFLAGSRCLYQCIKIFSSPAASSWLSTFPPPLPTPRFPLDLPPTLACPSDVLPPTHTHASVSEEGLGQQKAFAGFSRCLPSPQRLTRDVHSRAAGVFISGAVFSPNCFLRGDLFGDFPGLQPLFDSWTSLSALSYYVK